MTESMIERVAKAICAAVAGHSDPNERDHYWDNWVSDDGKKVALEEARAAIEAMREPTDRMLEIDAPDMPAGGSVIEVWQNMIDAALIYPAGSADRAGVPLARD